MFRPYEVIVRPFNIQTPKIIAKLCTNAILFILLDIKITRKLFITHVVKSGMK